MRKASLRERYSLLADALQFGDPKQQIGLKHENAADAAHGVHGRRYRIQSRASSISPIGGWPKFRVSGVRRDGFSSGV